MPFMKPFPKWILIFSILLMTFVCLPALINAQTEPDSTPHDPCNEPLDYCPIDGGLSALLVVGVGFGIKKARDARKVQGSINWSQ